MSYLFLTIFLLALLIVMIPSLFKLVFVYFLGFKFARLHMKHPFKYLGTFIQKNQPLWALELFTLYLPSVSFEVDWKCTRIRLLFDNPKIFLSRNS